MLKISKNIPIPKAIRPASPSRRKYPFDELEIGDMFFVQDRPKNNLTTHASTVGRKLGRKFETRLCVMHQLRNGTWEPCDASHPKANLGIGVFRTA